MLHKHIRGYFPVCTSKDVRENKIQARLSEGYIAHITTKQIIFKTDYVIIENIFLQLCSSLASGKETILSKSNFQYEILRRGTPYSMQDFTDEIVIIQTDKKNMSQMKNSKKLRAELAKIRWHCTSQTIKSLLMHTIKHETMLRMKRNQPCC